MNLEELKQWTTDRLDYEDNEIGKEHSEYRGHYYAGVLALLAKLEAAQRLRDELKTHPCILEDGNFDHEWKFVDDSFDHEYGTEVVRSYECKCCNATKDYEGDDE